MSRLPHSVASHGTLFGGKLDCFVVEGGQAVVTIGRTASVEVRLFTDHLLTLTPPIHFEHDGKLFVGADAEALVDALMLVRGDRSANETHLRLATEWLRLLMTHGLREMADSLPEVQS